MSDWNWPKLWKAPISGAWPEWTWVDTDVASATASSILAWLSVAQKIENLSSMTWIKEGLVEVFDKYVQIWRLKLQHVDNNLHCTDAIARSTGAMRWEDFNLIRRTVWGDVDQFADFCERVLDIRKWQAYRMSSSTRWTPDIVQFQEGIWFLSSPDRDISTERWLAPLYLV